MALFSISLFCLVADFHGIPAHEIHPPCFWIFLISAPEAQDVHIVIILILYYAIILSGVEYYISVQKKLVHAQPMEHLSVPSVVSLTQGAITCRFWGRGRKKEKKNLSVCLMQKTTGLQSKV